MMGPNWTRTYSTYSNDDTGTSGGSTLLVEECYGLTFYPTYPNEAEVIEDQEAVLKEIEHLEDMMRQSGIHEDNKYSQQRKELHYARLAPMKHKRPHMNKRIIR